MVCERVTCWTWGQSLPALNFVQSGTEDTPLFLIAHSREICDTKTLNLSRNTVSLQVFVDVSRFSSGVINLLRGLKKVVAKSRARVYFEQQILALLLVFHQIHNLSRNKFARSLAYQPISTPHFQPATNVFVAGQVNHAR